MTTNNNKGLGKGLGALISLFDEDMEGLETPAEFKHLESTAPPRGNLPQEYAQRAKEHFDEAIKANALEIDINLIDNNSNQPRKVFDKDCLEELKQSIIANGVLQPILVNKVGSRYMIVAGERRWRASKEAGLKTIPALVRSFTSKQIAEVALVENLMRSDLNEIEVANGISQLMKTHMMTQDQVSKVLGKSRSSIANSLRFLNLPKDVQLLLEENKISAGHAKILAGIDNAAQCLYYAQKCAEGMTVRELEFHLTSRSSGDLKAPTMKSIELRHCELSLTQTLSTKVNIIGSDNRGKIVVEYSSKKDLERIINRITKP